VTSPRPFRFIAPMPPFDLPPHRWRDELRRIEDLGFSSVSVSEHIVGGWAMDPLAVMMAAADATKRLRVLSLVLMNDLRHPVVLHRAAATIDRLSGGRLELGIGAGWLARDYVALGRVFDPAPVRIERLAESIEIITRLFADQPVTFMGRHVGVHDLAGSPKAVQRPRPPILVGGGGRRLLQLAARTADIVGVHAAMPGGELTPDVTADFSAERLDTKVAWVREALVDAGRADDDVELQFSVYLCRIGGQRRAQEGTRSTFAERLAVDPKLLVDSPSVLIGSVDACADLLIERRARFGFSYLRLSDDIDAVAPLIRKLAGR
jgi:probable F420-dependent oxidoreductase